VSGVEAVVATAVPDRTLAAVERVASGNRRRTAVARFADDAPLVVQLSADAEAVATEATLRRAVRRRTSIPVPPAVAVGTLDGTGYLVSEYRSGRDLHAVFADMVPERQRAVARNFGTYLGELHAAFGFDSCGALRRDESGTDEATATALTASGDGCSEWLQAYGERAIARLPDSFDPLRERLHERVSAAARATTDEPRLYPWDLRPGNALADDDGVTAVVDWEGPLAAPPGVALAKTTYLVAAWYVEESDPLREALRRGYRRVRPLPTVHPGYRVAAVADSAVDSAGVVTRPGYPEWSRERAVTFHRRALAEAVTR